VASDDRHLDLGDDAGATAGPGETAGPGTTLRVNKGLTIPMSEITWRATTSGGPGGQHANRTLSRVEVQFDVAGSVSLGPRQRARLLERYGPVVRAAAAESRSQARNRQLALERLAGRLAEGLRVDPTRRPTKPTKGSQVRRVEEKRHRSQVKRQRRAPNESDE
jgi:ribosome-associated protein